MPLLNCPDCEGKVSDSATHCPHCGLPDPASRVKTINSAKDSVNELLEIAECGDADAQNKIGISLTDLGQAAEAIKWYRLSAEQDWPDACYNLAMCFFHGEGVEVDYSEGEAWAIRAADLNFAQACLDLGVAYLIGDKLPKNDDLAIKMFLKGSDLGDANCAYNAGCMYSGYETRSFMSKDFEKAERCFKRAILNGFEGNDAANNLEAVKNDIRAEELDREIKQLNKDIANAHKDIANTPTYQNTLLKTAHSDLNSKLRDAGGFKCPSCSLNAGVRMDAGMKGTELGRSLRTGGSAIASFIKSYMCQSCGYTW